MDDCYVNTSIRTFELVHTALTIPPRSKEAINYLRDKHLYADDGSYAEEKNDRFETASAFAPSRGGRPSEVLMFRNKDSRFQLVLVAVATLLLAPQIEGNAIAGAEEQVCDVSADYSLGVEDYSAAIRRHVEVTREHPDNALAHYHLGFAQGMMGDRKAEVKEYQRAEALGLRDWDLFLNLGLAQFESGDLDASTYSLRQAVLLGENHSESHFNLALVEERRGLYPDAEREIQLSLRLNPGQPDARNLLGVIYAKEQRTTRAWLVWRELVHDVPDYQPARLNSALLSNQNEAVLGETAAVVPPPAAAVKAIEDQRKPSPPIRETGPVLVPHNKLEGE